MSGTLLKRATILQVLIGLPALAIAGCLAVTPASKAYAPPHGSFEASLFATARRDIFPDDVRQQPQAHKNEILAFTGVIRSSRIEGDFIVTDYEHHFWDWVEDYGAQRERVFLSPRGEGKFRCRQPLASFSEGRDLPLPKPGFMAIAYGAVDGVERDSTVVLRCAPLIKTLPPERFGTDIWDYGRSYLLAGDETDFRALRVPR